MQSTPTTQPKRIDQVAVLKAAETLMLQNEQTTTLEVKNYLRQQGYQAYQSAISSWMNWLARQQKWNAEYSNRHYIYKFGADTEETLHKYLEKGGEFWEVKVQDREVLIGTGKTGENGTYQKMQFASNRKAIYHVHNLLINREKDNFVEAIDQRLPLSLRLEYQAYFKEEAILCTMSFYNVQKTEKQTVIHTTKYATTQKSDLQITKNAGYEFSWNLYRSSDKLKQILAQTAWDACQVGYESAELKGETITAIQDHNGQAIPLKDYRELPNLNPPKITALQVSQAEMYQVSIAFKNGAKVYLSSFQYDLQDELIPLVKKLLDIA